MTPHGTRRKPIAMFRLACAVAAPIAVAAALGVTALGASGAGTQASTKRCTPSNTTHTVVVRLPGVKVAQQTCVIRFTSAGSVKAWVHTKWARTNSRTRFRRYSVQVRLQLRNVPSKRLTCRYARAINTTSAGERTCETTLEVTQARGWTSDGAVVFDAGRGARVRGLRGSPSV
jgi:hypothetical protein